MAAKKTAGKSKKMVVKKDTVKKLTDEEMKKAGGGMPIEIISKNSATCRGKPCCKGHTGV